MNVKSIKTKRFIPGKSSLEELLNEVPKIKDGSIIVISSKIVSICENNVIEVDSIDYYELIKRLSDTTLEPKRRSENGMILTQVGSILVESAGIDHSNANGYYVMLPKNPTKSAKYIWERIKKRDGTNHLGIIISDSHSVPRRRGAMGFAIASYGFKATKEYSHEKDIFNDELTLTATDVADSLAAVANLEMGEGNEGTPMAIVTNAHNVEFFDKAVAVEVAESYSWVNPDLDVYAPLLDSELWKR